MAALYGILDRDPARRGTGRRQLTATANVEVDSTLKTHQTTVRTYLNKDGSGYLIINRGNESLRLDWHGEQTITKKLDLTTGELQPDLTYSPLANDHNATIHYQPAQPTAPATTDRAGK